MTQVQVVTKSVLRRDWRNIEPKLIAGLIAALGSAQVIAVIVGLLTGTGNVLLTEVATVVPTLAFLVVGYLKASTHKGALIAKVEADLPGDLGMLAHTAIAAHHGSNIAPVPVTTRELVPDPSTIVLPGEPTPTLPQQ